MGGVIHVPNTRHDLFPLRVFLSILIFMCISSPRPIVPYMRRGVRHLMDSYLKSKGGYVSFHHMIRMGCQSWSVGIENLGFLFPVTIKDEIRVSFVEFYGRAAQRSRYIESPPRKITHSQEPIHHILGQ